MPNVIMYTNAGALWLAGLARAELADSKLRLFKQGEIELNPATTPQELALAECDFSGYPAGGADITAWLAPILAPEGGYSIQSPTQQFATANPTTVGNVVGGWWVEDDVGNVVVAAQFQDGWPMEVFGQGLPIDVRLVYPATGSSG